MTDAPGNARDSKPLCRYLTPSEKLGLIGPQLGATTAAAYNERLTNTSIMELRKRKIYLQLQENVSTIFRLHGVRRK